MKDARIHWGARREWTDGKRRAQRIHAHMLERCRSPKAVSYNRYGARGIDVCERWESFDAFWKDMGDPPSWLHSLERIDNEKGYNPDNCRWATAKEQSNNTRFNIFVEMNGERRTLKQWSDVLGMPYRTVWHRVANLNWNPNVALLTPVRKISSNRRLSLDSAKTIRSMYTGKRGDVKKLSEQFGVSQTMICYVLQNKVWSEVK